MANTTKTDEQVLEHEACWQARYEQLVTELVARHGGYYTGPDLTGESVEEIAADQTTRELGDPND